MSAKIDSNDYNTTNDKSLMGRELLMPDELMRFKFGEALFMKTRMYPIKCKIIPIDKYPIKIKIAKIPTKINNNEIKCFNLEQFRKNKVINSMNNKVEID